jgi:hypothetical protein
MPPLSVGFTRKNVVTPWGPVRIGFWDRGLEAMRQFTCIGTPRSFIQAERLFEHEKVMEVKAPFRIVAMLPD